MKTEIKTVIQKLLDSYREVKKDLTVKINEWERDTIYSDDYKKEKIKELQKEAEQYDSLFNSKVKEAVLQEKKAIIGEPESKPADYQVQISNALKFIELAGNKLTDDQAYGILKPFQGDVDTMNLFQSVVGNLVQGDMFHTFNKTFGKTNDFMALINSFEVAEKTADNLLDFKDKSLNGAIKTNMFLDSINTIEKLANTFEA